MQHVTAEKQRKHMQIRKLLHAIFRRPAAASKAAAGRTVAILDGQLGIPWETEIRIKLYELGIKHYERVPYQ
jgi:hypothetical protein